MPTSALAMTWSQLTGSVVHDVPETPTPVIGEQSKPMGTLTPWRTTPMAPRRLVMLCELELWTESQQAWVCASDVVATARMVAAVSLENIILLRVVELGL